MLKTRGFTLVEMAMVLLIVGLVTISLLSPLMAQRDQERLTKNLQLLEEAKEALLGFVAVNGYFPCPDLDPPDGKGLESDNPGADCHDKEGHLPWAVLGTGRADAWGNPFRYRLDKELGKVIRYTDYSCRYTIPTTLSTMVTSALIVQDRKGNTLTNSNIAAIILSCGKNGQAEGVNVGTTHDGTACSYAESHGAVYTQDEYVPNEFDDMVVWLTTPVVINRLVNARRWPPPSVSSASLLTCPLKTP